MPLRAANGWCPKCHDWRLGYQNAPNHLIHLIITFFLCGLWLPIWLLICLANRDPYCSICGTLLGNPPTRPPQPYRVPPHAETAPTAGRPLTPDQAAPFLTHTPHRPPGPTPYTPSTLFRTQKAATAWLKNGDVDLGPVI